LNWFERFFTVIYFDTRGSGRSERPPNVTDYKYDQFSADLDVLRNHLHQEQIWIIGHSGGGWLAMHYAIAYPNRCSGLVLLDSIAANDAEWRKDVTERQTARRNEPWYEETIQASSDPRTKKDEKVFCEALNSTLRFAFHDVKNFAKFQAGGGFFSLPAFKGMAISNKGGAPLLPLEKITVPTIIVAGASDDRASPLQAERIHSGIRGSKLIVIEKAGHFPWLEQPDNFFAAVETGLETFGLTSAAPIEK
jgi:proline iminopeptidase